jgi:carboxylesterase
MPQPPHLDPGPYAASGGPIGVLLIHGYTGSVAETSPMGKYLAQRGLTVHCPLLPGHGTTVEDLDRIRWQAWADEVESAWRGLRDSCQVVFVGGLSLGGLLSLWLGIQHAEITGLLIMAPAIKVRTRLLPLVVGLRHFLAYNPLGGMTDDLADPQAVERIWCYDELPLWGVGEISFLQRHVRRDLPRIHQPLLIFQGRRDTNLDPGAAEIVHDRAGSTDKTLIWLENSGHNVLADGEREKVWEASYRWIVDHAGIVAGH